MTSHTLARLLSPFAVVLAVAGAPLQAKADNPGGGDIPDNQVFLVYHNRAEGYSVKYPEGWARSGQGSIVSFRDKNNFISVTVSRGGLPTAIQVRKALQAVPGASIRRGPDAITIHGKRAIHVAYTTRSAPNAVTGKRVVLVVDRYYVANAGRRAMVDLGTPVGVDNVDAYRLIIESFRWS